jgi:hypothetical protein
MKAEEEFSRLGAAAAAFAKERLLPAEGEPPPAADLRTLRAIRALARSGTKDGRDALRALASGAADAPLRAPAESLLRAAERRAR